MKRYLLILFLFCLGSLLYSQVKQDKTLIPFFDIVQADGKHIRATDLVQGQPLMLVYFDPDCDHCVAFIGELLKNTRDFNDIQILLVTYVPLKRLRTYITEAGLAAFPQIKVGTEGNKYTVRYHYEVIQFPFLALHDKYGKLFATFESNVPPPSDLARMFK